ENTIGADYGTTLFALDALDALDAPTNPSKPTGRHSTIHCGAQGVLQEAHSIGLHGAGLGRSSRSSSALEDTALSGAFRSLQQFLDSRSKSYHNQLILASMKSNRITRRQFTGA